MYQLHFILVLGGLLFKYSFNTAELSYNLDVIQMLLVAVVEALGVALQLSIGVFLNALVYLFNFAMVEIVQLILGVDVVEIDHILRIQAEEVQFLGVLLHLHIHRYFGHLQRVL